jgi:hypothetical protein
MGGPLEATLNSQLNSQQDQRFDYKKAVAELNASERDAGGRKLSLEEQCAAFSALANHIRSSVVAKTFGISRVAASQIKGCLSNRRYLRVAEEFNLMGEDAFHARYFTEALQLRLRQAQHDLNDDAIRFRRGRPNPRADAKSFARIGAFEIDPGEFWRVDQMHEDNPKLFGWYFDNCQPNGDPLELRPNGDPKGKEALAGGDPEPFRSANDAWKAAWTYCNRRPPQ